MRKANNNLQRNSNIELLRIINMILIILHHYSLHGFDITAVQYSLNKYLIAILEIGGKVGVMCFVIITGYFMVTSKVTLRKLLLLIGEVAFYSIGIQLLFNIMLMPQDSELHFDNIFSIVTQYWFINNYVLLYLIIPLLNISMRKMNKITHLLLILALGGYWIIGPLIDVKTTGLIMFILMYYIGAFIRKYVGRLKMVAKIHIGLVIALSLTLVSATIMCIFMGNRPQYSRFETLYMAISGEHSPLSMLIAVEMVMISISLKQSYSEITNIVSSATLGVYLIHENMLIYPYLWHHIFKNELMATSPYLLIHVVVACIIVFVLCTVIDLLRQATVEKVYLHVIDKFIVMWQRFRQDKSSQIETNNMP